MEWIDGFAPGQRVRGRRAVRGRAASGSSRSPATSRATRPGSSAPARTPPPANFAGRVGAFLAELSFQLFGYAAYLDPGGAGDRRLALLLVPSARRGRHQGDRRRRCCSPASARSWAWSSAPSTVSGKSFRAGGYAGELLARQMSEYLNRTGSVIVVLTLMVLAIIISTQFSFGRFFAAAIRRCARRRDSRR